MWLRYRLCGEIVGVALMTDVEPEKTVRAFVVAIAGCASRPMAFQPDQNHLGGLVRARDLKSPLCPGKLRQEEFVDRTIFRLQVSRQ